MLAELIEVAGGLQENQRLKNSVNADIIDLESLSSLKSWRTVIKTRLDWLKIRGTMSEVVHRCMIGLLNKPHQIITISDQASVVVHRWGSGEYKIVPVWRDRYIIQNTFFWLQYYPFLDHIDTVNCKALLQCSVDIADIDSSVRNLEVILASHNNHFGHFLADNYPTLCLASKTGLLGQKKSNVKSTYPVRYCNGIINALSSLVHNTDSATPWILDLPSGTSRRIENLFCHEFLQTNAFTGIFLWHQLKDKLFGSRRFHNRRERRKISLLRNSDCYNTRIANYGEIKAILDSRGFEVLFPENHSVEELLHLIGSADIVVAESGTSTLNAIMFASAHTRVVSLCPARIFIDDDPHMILSGLPYILGSPYAIRFLTGISISKDPIPSSDICYYESSSLASILDGN